MANSNVAKPALRAARILLALLVIALGLFVARASYAIAVADRLPAQTLAIDPGNAVANSKKGMERLTEITPGEAMPDVVHNVRRALLRDPTMSSAALGMGLAAEQNGKAERAQNAFRYSQALSRRELPTQMWLINDAAVRDHVAEALRHYDIALRTSRPARSLLFPGLVKAVSDRRIVSPLAMILIQDTEWSGEFIQHLAQNGDSLAGISNLFAELNRLGHGVNAQALSTALDRATASGNADTAWKLYQIYNPERAAKALRNGSFGEQPQFPSPFDWRYIETAGVIVGPRDEGTESLLAFSTPMDWSGLVASQVLRLATGRHRLTAISQDIDQPQSSLPVLQLDCLSGGDTIQRATIPPSPTGQEPFTWAFEVPQGCPYQELKLVIRAGNTPQGVTGAITKISIR